MSDVLRLRYLSIGICLNTHLLKSFFLKKLSKQKYYFLSLPLSDVFLSKPIWIIDIKDIIRSLDKWANRSLT